MFKNKKIFYWELGSTLFIIFVGAFLHFVYQLSSYSEIVAFFAPVNESVWEHLKLGFWTLFIFLIIEYFFINKLVRNFFLAKFVGIIAMELTIVIIFYSYIFFTKENILVIDISSFIIGAIICGLICLKIYKLKLKTNFDSIAAIGLILIAFVSMFLTFFPPKLPIFFDNSINQYGIPQHINEGSVCQQNQDCQKINCLKYDTKVKSGFKPYCQNQQCRCLCLNCE
ncbi:MAG: DUF6512 family protein [Patescibacteria group bacterium]|nr:DUF6512 family protein [Patescibacteria group bacterium]